MEGEAEEPSESNRRLSYIRQCQACCWVFCMPIIFGFIRARPYLYMWGYFLTTYRQINVPGLLMAVEIVSTLVSGISIYILGRRRMVIITNTLLIVAMVLVVSSVTGWIEFTGLLLTYAGRQFYIVLSTVYVAEIADPRMRPVLIGFFYMIDHASYMFTQLLRNWHNLIAISIVAISVGSLVISYNGPETPYWLALTNEFDKSEEVFVYLRAGYSDIDEADIMMNKAESDAKAREQGLLHNVRSSGILAPFIVYQFILLANVMAQDMIDPIFAQLNIQYKSAVREFSRTDYYMHLTYKDFLTMISSLIGSILFLLLCQIVPHRVLYMGSVILSVLVFFTYFLASNDIQIPLNAIMLCYLFEYLGSFQVLQLISAEMFPSSIRELSVMICQLELIYIIFIREWSVITAFSGWFQKIVLSVRSFFFPFGIFFTMLFMPETKGLTLAEAEELSRILPFTREPIVEEEE